MVDWKKEIKLSDLVSRRTKQAEAPQATPAQTPEQKRAAARLAAPRMQSRQAQLVGLKIGSSQLAAALVANNGGAQLVRAARRPLEAGIVAAGEVQDGDALAAALREFFHEHELPRRPVRLGVASTRIGVRTFEISGIDDDSQLVNAIKFRAEETLPVPFEQAALDYQILSDTSDENGVRTVRALLVVAYRELIDAYVAACDAAGIELVGIDLEPFAMLRALAPPSDAPLHPDNALVAVSVGHDRTILAVSDGLVCEFTRVLEWGGSTLDARIAEALGVTSAEAEAVKRTLSLDPGDPPPEGLSAERATETREAVRRELQRFVRDLVSSLQFYQSQPRSLSIAEIVVTGGTADLRGFDREVERLTGVPTRLADPLARVGSTDGTAGSEHLGSLTVAIGLGIED